MLVKFVADQDRGGVKSLGKMDVDLIPSEGDHIVLPNIKKASSLPSLRTCYRVRKVVYDYYLISQKELEGTALCTVTVYLSRV